MRSPAIVSNASLCSNLLHRPPIITRLHRKHIDLYIKFAGVYRDSAKALEGIEAYRVTEKTTPLLSFLKVGITCDMRSDMDHAVLKYLFNNSNAGRVTAGWDKEHRRSKEVRGGAPRIGCIENVWVGARYVRGQKEIRRW